MRRPVRSGEIDALALETGRPLLAVDADEVLVLMAEHFDRFLRGRGWRLELSAYRLDGAMVEIATGFRAGREQGWAMIDAFFAEETQRQSAVAGAAVGLAAIAGFAQVVVLTNVPGFAAADRVANLLGHGIDYPVIVNEGGKGRALAALSRRVWAPVAFVDDSPSQIASAARHAPEVTRLHFVGSPMVRAVVPPVPEAHHAPPDWPGIVATLRGLWGR
jgi:hypothetical protein